MIDDSGGRMGVRSSGRADVLLEHHNSSPESRTTGEVLRGGSMFAAWRPATAHSKTGRRRGWGGGRPRVFVDLLELGQNGTKTEMPDIFCGLALHLERKTVPMLVGGKLTRWKARSIRS